MLAQPSSVGGGPHIPPSRSVCVCVWRGVTGAVGVGGWGVWFTYTHTHAYPVSPRTLPQESSQKPAAALSGLSHNKTHCKNTHHPRPALLKAAAPFLFVSYQLFFSSNHIFTGLIKGLPSLKRDFFFSLLTLRQSV